MTGDYKETLYTIDKRGRRKWVYPALAAGAWFTRRQAAAALLIAFYLSLPWISIGGRQAVLLNFAERKFYLFGIEFWATDTYYLALLLGALAIALFLFTALFGRIWCGWACPETVFLEFLFRPLERWIEGGPAQRQRLDKLPWSSLQKLRKKLLKHSLCALFSWILASTALALFVGREPLLAMMTDWPFNHPAPFGMTLVLMAVMAFQFGWFREQFCTVLCPYARFQSVMLDDSSLVVGYDAGRGEPRGKLQRGDSSSTLGDCIDCGLCVRVCPTGIDIRNGLQMECIACTQCIDACDSIMEELRRPAGLIRYSTSGSLLGGSGRVLRPRVAVYSLILLVYLALFVQALSSRELSEVQIVRGARDKPFSILTDGRVTNHLHARISNKSDGDQGYTLRVVDPPGFELVMPLSPFPVKAGKIATVPIFVNFPINLLRAGGKRYAKVEVTGGSGYRESLMITVLGPGE